MLGCAAGGALILVAQAVTWATAAIARPTGGVQDVSVAGHEVSGGLPAVGWALIVLALALLAARGVLRQVVGAVVALVGAVAVALAVTAPGRVDAALVKAAYLPPAHPVHAGAGGWWVVAALGGVLAVLAGGDALVRGTRWGGLGARYDSPAGAEAVATDDATPATPITADEGAVWQALDRGEDPT